MEKMKFHHFLIINLESFLLPWQHKAVWRTAISPATEWQWSGLNIQGSNWWPSIVTLSLQCWVKGSAHHLRRTFDLNLINIFQRVQEIWSEHEIQGSNSWPLTMNLTLGRHAWVMGSAYRLTKANIWSKFQNLSKGSGDMERTRKRWMTFNCDLVLESASLSYKFYTSSH